MDRDDQAHAKLARFPRINFDDVELNMSVDYLLKGILDRGASAEVYGPPGGGKTFFCLDIFLSDYSLVTCSSDADSGRHAKSNSGVNVQYPTRTPAVASPEPAQTLQVRKRW